jgi:hypothetical protein
MPLARICFQLHAFGEIELSRALESCYVDLEEHEPRLAALGITGPVMTSMSDAHVRGEGRAGMPDKVRDSQIFRAIRNSRATTHLLVTDGETEAPRVAKSYVQADTMSPKAVSVRTT